MLFVRSTRGEAGRHRVKETYGRSCVGLPYAYPNCVKVSASQQAVTRVLARLRLTGIREI